MKNHNHAPSCKQMLGNLSEFIDGDLQAELCSEIEEHLKNCKNCRIVVDTLKKTVELYEKCASEETNLPNDVRERLFKKLALDDLKKHQESS
ncbi:anti-sigma factor family protein [Flexilinea flocculi]|jgi:anti-sigma factor (TIGR02949 family)|uniref:Putative zinc-finger n=1 Tax=Flexilinea flocculi TaxID=1678840 RepID=A0A0S7BV63_9CHLR|nr:zf-HC2 domain-containing protein [Flexilinea flocculi]NMB93613.1 zf-HC2 domain-containing protein [Flexilinea flocculi]GAP41630.1 putative zinc-finger [Flexilinea flocculi]